MFDCFFCDTQSTVERFVSVVCLWKSYFSGTEVPDYGRKAGS
jgi:hypothetical protein